MLLNIIGIILKSATKKCQKRKKKKKCPKKNYTSICYKALQNKKVLLLKSVSIA